MTDDLQLRLNDVTRTLARRIVRPRAQTRMGTIAASFDANGNILPDAVSSALGGLVLTWYVSGALTTGTNLEREIELPIQSRLLSIRLRAKTAPTSTEATMIVTANGAEIGRASIAKTINVGRSLAINALIDPGAVLRIDCESAGGAANVTVTACYLPV